MTPVSRLTGRTVAGAILILLGVLFTLDNFGVIEAGDLFHYWPLLLVGFGILKVAQAQFPEQRLAGAIVAGVGALLLLRTLHVVNFRMREVWPVFLVIGGGLLIWRSSRRRSAEEVLSGARGAGDARVVGEGADGFRLNDFAFLGGGERIVRSQDFRGGEVTAIMGGFEIDLRGAAIAGDEAVLEIFALWGGVEIRVPDEWIVEIRAMPILGGFSETTHGAAPPASPAAGPRKRLVVRGTAIMGGVEVKR